MIGASNQSMLDFFVTSLYLLTRACLPEMKENWGGGSLILVPKFLTWEFQTSASMWRQGR
ncbi:MAG: hypothetical protein M2R45_04109 [Verrucomicrobia subdivision 3 bacterium]|nr:hypothetical protein [Limisphaerales bacterium]MCS1417090.1 hypothetical protein [Limisphaerales bacterium]